MNIGKKYKNLESGDCDAEYVAEKAKARAAYTLVGAARARIRVRHNGQRPEGGYDEDEVKKEIDAVLFEIENDGNQEDE